MITVHHLENSRSQRILWMLEELGAEYEIKRYERDKKTQLAPKELEQVHPLGKSPVITDGANTVAESGAIVEYLAERYGNGKWVPEPGTQQMLDYRYWMHAAEGTVAALLVMALVFSRTHQKPVPFFIRPITKAVADQVEKGYYGPTLKKAVDLMEQTLAKQTWFAGDTMTAVDFQMSFPVEALAASDRLQGYPKLQAFYERIQARDAYQRALKRGGPYQLGPR